METISDIRTAATLLDGRRIATDDEDRRALRRLVDLRLARWHYRLDGETAYTLSPVGRSIVEQSRTLIGQ